MVKGKVPNNNNFYDRYFFSQDPHRTLVDDLGEGKYIVGRAIAEAVETDFLWQIWKLEQIGTEQQVTYVADGEPRFRWVDRKLLTDPELPNDGSPSGIFLTSAKVNAGALADTLVGYLYPLAKDIGEETYAFQIISDASNKFKLDPNNNNRLLLSDTADGADNQYQLEIMVVDSKTRFYTELLTIDVVNLRLSNTLVNETVAVGTKIADITAVDDTPPTSFNIVADPDDKFEIVGSELRLKNKLDFYTSSSHQVEIEFVDSLAVTRSEVFTIEVTVDNASVMDRFNRALIDSPTRDTFTAVESVVANTRYNPVPVSTYADDSFGRIKVAPPHLLFDSSFQYTLQDKVFIRSELINATITHDSNRAAARLETTIDVGSRARLRSRNYFPYSPAFTNTMIGSFCFHGSIENVTKRLGLYDEENGFFIQVRGQGFEVAIRSSITGSVVDNIIEQSNWNVDKMDGSGDRATNPSGVLLDATKQNIMFLEFQWLGSGRAQFAFIIDGNKYIVHEFQHANILDSLYSQTATLPIQAEIIGNGVSSFMEFTCCSMASNGATAQHGHLYVASNGSSPRTAQTVGVQYPIISIRKADLYSKVPVQILDISAFSTTNDDFLIQIIHKAALTGAVWVDIPGSLCQKDVSATTITGGDLVAEFYMKGNLQASEKLELLSRFWDLTLGNDFNGNSELMTMVAVPLTTNAGIYGVISFKVFE